METTTRVAAVSLVAAIPIAVLGLLHVLYAHLSRVCLAPTFSPLHHPEAIPLMVVAAGSLVAFAALFLAIWRWLLLEKEVGVLHQAADVQSIGGAEVHVLDAPGVRLFAAGLRGPKIFATRAALNVMTPSQMRAAVWHERSHLAHGDTRFRAVYGAIGAAVGWIPGISRTVSAAIFLEERRADVAALESGSNTTDLIGAIMAVSRGQGIPVPALGDNHVGLRLRCLSSSDGEPTRNPARAFGLTALAIAVSPVVAHIPMVCGL